MRVETMGRSVSVRSRKPLVVRGGLARTFGSLASFLAVSFLFCGLYLLADSFAHPLDAGPVSIFAAALAITLAAILFYYLLRRSRVMCRIVHPIRRLKEMLSPPTGWSSRLRSPATSAGATRDHRTRRAG